MYDGILQQQRGSSQKPLLLSKLRPPQLTSLLVERPTLLSIFDRTLTCPLTVLSAPAGYGKTTLFQQWLSTRQHQANIPPISWLSLDEEDNDPFCFWRYIFTASQAFRPPPTLPPISQTALELPQCVNHFMNEITRTNCQGMLVLENYQVLHEQQVHQTLVFLIDQLPPSFHLVLITRTDPPFSLARLRANNQLLEIGASQLAFSHSEMVCFLQQSLSFDLSATALAHIEKQTEGWIAGLRLFALDLQHCTDPSAAQHLLPTFTGCHHHLLDYFSSEVLYEQTDDVQTFLLQTSHLRQLCASLCDSVTGRTDSAQILIRLEHTGLFLQPIIDNESNSTRWYRYHILFAEAMQEQARRCLADDHRALCLQRAQNWYAQHGRLDEAIETAWLRKAHSDVLALLERLLQHPEAFYDHLYALVRWLQTVPEELIATSPTLCFAYASALTFGSSSDLLTAARFTQVMALLRSAEEQWQTQQQTASLAELYALRAMVFVRQGDISQAAQTAHRALAILAPHAATWRVVCQTVLAIEARSRGHFQASYQTMLSGLSLLRNSQEQEGAIVLKLFLGELCLVQGALFQAEELFQTVLQNARENSNDQARALIGTAQLTYERNQLSLAEQQARRALSISTSIDDQFLQIQATLVLAKVVATRGWLQEAMKMLDARLVQLDPLQFPQQYYEVVLWQIRFEISSGDAASAQRKLQLLQSTTTHIQQEQEALQRARLLLYSHATNDALPLLKAWQQEAAANERLRSMLEIGLLLSIAYHQSKQRREARKQVAEVLQLAHPHHYLRIFLDEGEIIPALLTVQLTNTHEKSLQQYIRAILHAFNNEQEHVASPVADSTSLLASLSPQERQVLRLLRNGMQRQEIAEHLVISLNTVKTHLQRLYQKLHVTNRVEAIEIARHLDLTGL